MAGYKDIIPKPPREVAGELPGATDKVKNARGTFLLWVLTVMSAVIGILGWGLYLAGKGILAEKDKQIAERDIRIKDLEEENREYKYYVVPTLREIKPQVEVVAQKADSVSLQAVKTEEHFNKILKKANDVKRAVNN